MSEPMEDAKSSGPESVVTNSPHGMELDAASSPTSWQEEEAAATCQKTSNGPAALAIGEEITQDRNGVRLSEPERLRLKTIRKNWDRGWLPLFDECRFILELAERLEQ